MVTVVPRGAPVPLDPQPLDPDVVPPALQRPRAVLDAPDRLGPGDQGDLRVADGGVAMAARGPAVVGHCGGLQDWFAKGTKREV